MGSFPLSVRIAAGFSTDADLANNVWPIPLLQLSERRLQLDTTDVAPHLVFFPAWAFLLVADRVIRGVGRDLVYPQ